MVNHVLVPVDRSELSEGALQAAIELAQKFEARLTVFYALPTAGAYAYATVPPFVQSSELEAKTLGVPPVSVGTHNPHCSEVEAAGPADDQAQGQEQRQGRSHPARFSFGPRGASSVGSRPGCRDGEGTMSPPWPRSNGS